MVCERHDCNHPAEATCKFIWATTKNSSIRHYCVSCFIIIGFGVAKRGLARVTATLHGADPFRTLFSHPRNVVHSAS